MVQYLKDDYFSDFEIFAFVIFKEETSQTQRKNYLAKVLKHLSTTCKVKKDRITFLISQADDKRVYYQLFPKEFSEDYTVWKEEYLIIKAEDFEKLEKLFQTKVVQKK